MKPTGEHPSTDEQVGGPFHGRNRRACWLRGLFLALLFGISTGCGASTSSNGGGAGSETNWLARCDEDSDCNQGSCLCDVCTVVCERDAECAEINEAASCTPASELDCPELPTQSLCGESDTPFSGEEEDSTDGGGTDGANTDTEGENGPGVSTPSGGPGPPLVSDVPPDKVDLLFVIDNSLSMADKQEALSLALPDLVSRLVSPRCIDQNGNDTGTTPPTSEETCPQGEREFEPIADIHIGVITSSLGGYGSYANCTQTNVEASEQNVDMAHLLGTLPRGAAAAPSAAASGFLAWSAGSQRDTFVAEFESLVLTAGEFGCGWEATLEAWYRFLVEPYPYTGIERQPCAASDTNDLCAGPATDGSGNMRVDQTVLNQRADFLRPDSLLSIVMLSDENDCSFQASGQMWRLAQVVDQSGLFEPAFRGTAACGDPAFGPDHECCHSCGAAAIPAGCPSETLDDGTAVAAGCDVGRRYEGIEEHPNLRCFQQKVRFGVDYLYPVERYSNALKMRQICPFENDLTPDPEDPSQCRDGTLVVGNPLFRDLQFERQLAQDPGASGSPSPVRSSDHIFLAGILGVPWQDIAVSADPSDELVYRAAQAGAGMDAINWNWLIGDRNVANTGGVPMPEDPLMRESIMPRSGANPATGEALAPPESGFLANAINGHEWNVADNNSLQYACIYPLAAPKECISQDEDRQRRDLGEAVPSCECTDLGGDVYQNPVCQDTSDSYGMTQRYARAFPGLRQLQVLHDVGPNALVASICPKELSNDDAPDYGYRPFVSSLMRSFRSALAP